jgi:translation elongation factor EF-Ts
VAAEGIVGVWMSGDHKTGALVEVNCETDFVARNDDFVAFAKKLAQLVAEKNPSDVARSQRCRSTAARSRACARRSCRRSARTSRSAASSASTRRTSSRATCTAAAASA